MDESRRKIQELVDSGLLPAEQARFMMASSSDPRAVVAVPEPLLERHSSLLEQVLIADGITRVKIDNPLGGLAVTTPVQEGVRVEVMREVAAEPGAGFEALLRQVRVVDMREGGTLKLRVHAPEMNEPHARLCARATVRVAGGLEVDGTAAGPLELVGLRGNCSWSAEGDVSIRDHQGDVHLHVDQGDVYLENCRGSFDLHVEHGNVVIRGCRGRLEVSCVDGDVALSEVRGDVGVLVPDGDVQGESLVGVVSVRSGTGSVRLVGMDLTALQVHVASGSAWCETRLSAAATARLESGDGDVALLVPRDSGARVTLECDDDAVRLEVPLSEVRREAGQTSGVLGDPAAATIHLAAAGGSVRLGWIPGD